MRGLVPELALRAAERPLGEQRDIHADERTALDALRDIAHIPDAQPSDVIRRLLALLRAGRLNYGRLARFARAEPPRVRALVGAMGDELYKRAGTGHRSANAITALRKSLNPLTRYVIPGVNDILPCAATWRIKSSR
jgi:hypothetical protein